MVNKKKVCKETGLLVSTDTKECPISGSKEFVDKYKGVAVIFDSKRSEVAEKLNAKDKGIYAMKY